MEKGMLVLAQRQDDKIFFVDPAGTVLGTITIIEVLKSGTVRLGFQFSPKDFKIYREKLWNAILSRDAANNAQNPSSVHPSQA